jgi:TRAP-type C4-dicarboxylate transport system permease small subunit
MREKIIRWIDLSAAGGGYVSALFLTLIVLLIITEIFLRTMFKCSTLIADEYSAYFFVAMVMLGLGLTLRDGAHIRITLISSRLGPKAGRVLDLAATVMSMAICTFALYHSTIMVYDTWRLDMTADTLSGTPIFMPQLFIPVGLFLFDLQLLAHFLRRLLSYPTP